MARIIPGRDGANEECARLVQRGGFRESYNPLTGDGLGARGFGWSTLVVDLVGDHLTPPAPPEPADGNARERSERRGSAAPAPDHRP